MKTSSWTGYKGPGRIGISRGAPRFLPGGQPSYKALAPTFDMLKLPKAEYDARFMGMLNRLDARQVWDDLHAMAGKDEAGNQIEPVLVCFEKPPFTPANWCHRTQVALWFKATLGVDVPEVGA